LPRELFLKLAQDLTVSKGAVPKAGKDLFFSELLQKLAKIFLLSMELFLKLAKIFPLLRGSYF
jgi:hypothetical protein